MRGLAIVALLIAACTRARPAPRPVKARAAAATVRAKRAEPPSNIERADYVGPATCGGCHPDEHARWEQSLHRVMNARADEPGAVIGDFSGASVAYAGGVATFSREAGAYVMTLARGGRSVRYRVTRTIGRRGLQEYVGVAAGGDGTEVRLPFGWWPRGRGWYPQPYYDPWLDEASFDAYRPVRASWAERCPWCHSTYPFALRIARAAALGVGHGLEQLVAAPAPPPGLRPPDELAVGEQVTVGISCESCHLGGRAHANGGDIHFTPSAAARPPRPFDVERRDPSIVNGVCAQCHSGPSPRLADGTALRNSSEALDLGASPCTGITCLDCHDPHRAGAPPAVLDARANAACVRCHAPLADAATARAHAGDGHAGVGCVDCHMPRVVLGIDRFVRTHRIGSPTAPAVLAAAEPNACNTCHLDRSIAWTAGALDAGWDLRLDPRRWARAYGTLDAPVGYVWLASRSAAIRVFAAGAYAASPLGRAALPRLLDQLADPVAYVRAWATFAVEQVLGHRLDPAAYDPRAPAAVRAAQLARLRARP